MDFNEVLNKCALAQNPELYVYASQLYNKMIKSKETVIIQVYESSPLFPKPPEGYKFSKPSGYAYIRVPVIEHDTYGNRYLTEEGKWIGASEYNECSTWQNHLVPIEEPKMPTIEASNPMKS